MKHYLLLFSLLILTLRLAGQGELISNMSFEYGIQLPAGDMSDRFGFNFKLGAGYEFIHTGSHWIFGLDGHYLFGSEVKEDVLAPLRTEEGDIIGNTREPASIFLRERGFHAGIYGGKLLPIRDNELKGFKFTLGTGFLQHKVRVQDDSQSVTQLTGEYKKGYDRLTNGISITAFAGYQHYDPNKNIYFLLGFDYVAGFTENRRTLNFDTMEREDKKRMDSLLGFRIGWILPITRPALKEEVYY